MVPGLPVTDSEPLEFSDTGPGTVNGRTSQPGHEEGVTNDLPEGKKSRRVRTLPPPSRALDLKRQPPPGPDAIQPLSERVAQSPRGISACLASAVVHCVLLIVLALIVDTSPRLERFGGVIAWFDHAPPELLSDALAVELLEPEPIGGEGVTMDMEMTFEITGLDEAGPPTEALDGADTMMVGLGPTQQTDLLMLTDRPVGGGLDGRRRDVRAALAEGRGGTAASEGAVERGLRWLALHQWPDGSWRFNHRTDLYNATKCRDPGTEASTTAATALTILPFLGAGHTHREGEFQVQLRKGLYYLTQRTLLTPNGHDMREGTMYAQGMGTMALCEAYAMTGDENLRGIAQGGIDFICYAQDKRGGGWRYTPGEPGDTTVTGWQLMALKSGQMAGLNVPSPSIFLAKRFLDSVQSDYGSQYGYMDPNPRQTTTAVGLLLRMYTGWPRNHPELGRGVRYLSEWKPSKDNMYFNYYATQVMHHYGGPRWEAWNKEMRQYLVQTQSQQGMENGSWYFSGGYGDKGGRLYNTAMAVMTLEVYYRYLPLYGRQVFETGF